MSWLGIDCSWKDLKKPLGSIDCESRGDFWEVLRRANQGRIIYRLWMLRSVLKWYADGIFLERLIKVLKMVVNQSWSAISAPWERIKLQDRFLHTYLSHEHIYFYLLIGSTYMFIWAHLYMFKVHLHCVWVPLGMLNNVHKRRLISSICLWF